MLYRSCSTNVLERLNGSDIPWHSKRAFCELVFKLYPLILLIFGVVILRYFWCSWIWVRNHSMDAALIFLLVAPYALEEDAHVRVDVFFRKWSKKSSLG